MDLIEHYLSGRRTYREDRVLLQASLTDSAPDHPVVQTIVAGVGNTLSLFAVMDGHKGARVAVFVEKNASDKFWQAAIELGPPDALSTKIKSKKTATTEPNSGSPTESSSQDAAMATAHTDSASPSASEAGRSTQTTITTSASEPAPDLPEPNVAVTAVGSSNNTGIATNKMSVPIKSSDDAGKPIAEYIDLDV